MKTKTIKFFGLNEEDFNKVQEKLKAQKQFLDYSYLYDKITNKHIPLKELIVSAYHSPDRYYGEIQNRINTLSQLAKEKNLKPVFMTITLPSAFHRQKQLRNGKLVNNPHYNDTEPREAVKVLTTMFAKLRQDRSLKELKKEERIYFRVNEPHRDGTPHTHILMFIPEERISRVIKAFHRLFDNQANDIQKITDQINNSVSYVMKYINKVLPLSKRETLSEKEQYLTAWYSKHRIVRFNSSRSLAPLSLYRLLHHRYSLMALTRIQAKKELTIYVTLDTEKVVEVFDGNELVYMRNQNYQLKPMGNSRIENWHTNDSALEAA